MIISHNLSALAAQHHESINSANLQKSMEILSSGERINRAGNDAAGLAISEKMRAQIRGLNQASRNVNDGISFIQATEGYLTETTDILQRIRELAVQSSNGIYTEEDRAMLQVEISQLVAEVDRIASQAQFNGLNLMTGRFAKDSNNAVTFHVGANVDQNIKVYVGTMTSAALGLKGTQFDDGEIISVADPDAANITISTIDEAIKKVNSERANLGAYQNRFEKAFDGINIAAENLTAAESRIRDADMAQAITEMVKNQLLQNASISVLGQANVSAQNVLQLLG